MIRVVALGDSFTCGEGVGVRTPAHLTWAAQLTARLPAAELTSYAAPGARVADVRERQLPAVGGADLVTVLAGLNDAAKTGFDATRFRADLGAVVRTAASTGAAVLLGRLHDPCRILSVPPPLNRLVRSRVAQVNDVVDELAAHPQVRVLDLAAVEVLGHRAGWAVDRVHPSVAGHAALGASAAQVLRDAGWDVLPEPLPPRRSTPSRAHRAWWMAAHGVPYAVTHAFAFSGPVLSALRRPLGGRPSRAGHPVEHQKPHSGHVNAPTWRP